MQINFTKKFNKFTSAEKLIYRDLYIEKYEITKTEFDLNIADSNAMMINQLDFFFLRQLYNLKREDKFLGFELGYIWFHGNKIMVKEGVFIPQFASEELVDIITKYIGKNNKNLLALEIGTGTGSLSISVAKEHNVKIDSIDLSSKAIELANKNIRLNKVTDKINLIHADLFKYNFERTYNFIFSNPPYVDYKDKNITKWVKENQPSSALYSENKGLKFYEYILSNLLGNVKYGGYIFLEIGYNQRKPLTKILEEMDILEYTFIKDLEDFDRYLIIKNEQ